MRWNRGTESQGDSHGEPMAEIRLEDRGPHSWQCIINYQAMPPLDHQWIFNSDSAIAHTNIGTRT